MYYVTVDHRGKSAVYDLNPTCKKTVVMVHGWPLSAAMYEYQTRVLADRGYRAVSYTHLDVYKRQTLARERKTMYFKSFGKIRTRKRKWR